MVVADEILYARLQPIRDWEDSVLFNIALARLTSVSLELLVEHAIGILNTLTLVLTILNAVIIELFRQYITESAILRELGMSTSSAEISSPNSSYLKAVKGANIVSALIAKSKLCFATDRDTSLHHSVWPSKIRKQLQWEQKQQLFFLNLNWWKLRKCAQNVLWTTIHLLFVRPKPSCFVYFSSVYPTCEILQRNSQMV